MRFVFFWKKGNAALLLYILFSQNYKNLIKSEDICRKTISIIYVDIKRPKALARNRKNSNMLKFTAL